VAQPELRAFRATVRGRVQGVGFRYSAVREAQSLRISGMVRNTSRGDVEVYAEAGPDALVAFASWLRQGPSGAHVHSVDLDWVPPTGAWQGFEVEF
jgi:acylphosphatase